MRVFAYEPIEPSLFHQGIAASSTDDNQAHRKALSSRVASNTTRYVRVEIREDMLHGLIQQGALAVEHLRGSDQQTHKGIRALLLNSLSIRK